MSDFKVSHYYIQSKETKILNLALTANNSVPYILKFIRMVGPMSHGLITKLNNVTNIKYRGKKESFRGARHINGINYGDEFMNIYLSPNLASCLY